MSSIEPADLERIVRELCNLPRETPWVEFKHNVADPVEIGEYISALSNSAALEGVSRAYMVWGVEDQGHAVVGTSFSARGAKGKGHEDLVPWLTRLLAPHIHFDFHEGSVDGESVVMLEIAAATSRPIQFSGTEYVRIDSYKKMLKDYPEYERRLWKSFDLRSFETLTALSGLSVREVLSKIDFQSFFRLSGVRVPDDEEEILSGLQKFEICRWDLADQWSITNLGAILFANNFDDFPNISRKAPRVIQYRGDSRRETLREQVGTLGYASGFQGLFGYIKSLIPESEVIDNALRRSELTYPELAIRELVANMLVHQDLSLGGSGPTVEIFEDRMEITNPGQPLIDAARFIDSPPLSRNEKLARALRYLRICEERGSGWDKIGFEIELHQLPAPLIKVTETHTRVTMFAPRPLTTMQKDDRVRAIYLHACLRYVDHKQVTNASVRDRFSIAKGNAAIASRFIKEAIEEAVIKPYDPTVGTKAMSYVPFWA